MSSKSKLVMAILAKKKPAAEEPSDSPGDLVDICREIIQAVKSGDAESLATCLRSAIDFCSGGETPAAEEE